MRQFPALFPPELDSLRLPPDDPLRRTVRLVNPIQGEGSILNSTLIPGLLRATRRNLARQVESVRIFEVGRVFLARGPGELPEEPLRASAVITRGERTSFGSRPPRRLPSSRPRVSPESLLDGLGRRAVFHAGSTASWLHPGASGELRLGNTVVCRLGEIHPEVAAAFEITVPCALLELDLSAVLATPAEPAPYREVSPYPAVRRDLAVRSTLHSLQATCSTRSAGAQQRLYPAILADTREGDSRGKSASRSGWSSIVRTEASGQRSDRRPIAVITCSPAFGGVLR